MGDPKKHQQCSNSKFYPFRERGMSRILICAITSTCLNGLRPDNTQICGVSDISNNVPINDSHCWAGSKSMGLFASFAVLLGIQWV